MTTAMAIRKRLLSLHRDERGVALALLALFLPVLLGMAALAVDIGYAREKNAQAQTAADAAALAGAQDLPTTATAITDATSVATANGFTTGGNISVTINTPPASGPHAGNANYVEVIIKNKVPTFFAPIMGLNSISTSSRAVAKNTSTVAGDNFVALRSDCNKHTLLVLLSGQLTVNGGVHVNSGDGDAHGPNGTQIGCGNENKGAPGYGDAFDIFGAGGSMTIPQIVTHGGWETHNNDTVSVTPQINQAILADPLASVPEPVNASYTIRHGTANSPSLDSISSGTKTLNPGVYYGGLSITGTAKVTLNTGVYIMAGGGLTVGGSSKLTGNGVMIYNTEDGNKSAYTAIDIDTTGSVVLSPMTTGVYSGLTFFQDRNATTNIVLNPGNGMSGLSGTAYAAGWDPSSYFDPYVTGGCPDGGSTWNGSDVTDYGSSTVIIEASGTANLQIVSAQILVCGATATFTFDTSGLATVGGDAQNSSSLTE